MKAILIARVSTEEQKEAGNSLPAQVARLEKYCQVRNFTTIKSFSFDESGYKNQREAFDAILDFVLEQREKVAVCCDKVDRLSRNIFDKRVSTLYEKALQDQLELHFVSDGQVINSRISAVEKFQFGISLGLAKYYSDAISDNVKRAIEQKLRKGEWIAKAPYGYKNTLLGDKKDICVDEYAKHIIHKVFELYATGAFSFELLCKKLKEDHNIVWSVSYIDKVFNNHFYYGVMVVNGQQYPHKYPPLISQALFEKVQLMKKSLSKKQSRYAGKPFHYRGLLRCDDCGFAITPEKHKGHVYYHCTEYNGKHGAKWLREEAITEQLGAIFKSLQMPEEVLKQITETLTEVHENKIAFQTKQFDALTREQKEVTKMMDNLYLDKLKGRITESAYDRFYQKFRDQITDISIRLEQLQEAEDHYYITVKYLLELTTRAYDLFMSSEVEEKRQLIKLVLSNLRLKGETLVYDAHQPFDLILKSTDQQLWRP
jgi:site-specific DNA recombinase